MMMAGAGGGVNGGLTGSFDAVAVVSGSFESERASTVPPGWVDLSGDLGQNIGQRLVPVLRGRLVLLVAMWRRYGDTLPAYTASGMSYPRVPTCTTTC